MDAPWFRALISFEAAAATAGTGLVLLAIGLARIVAARRGTYCPGPRPTWRRWFAPWLWVQTPLCGYDLARLSSRDDGLVCPECGRHLESIRRARKHAIQWRAERIGIMVILAAILAPRLEFVSTGRWARLLPTTGLVATERILGRSAPSHVRRETRRRTLAGELSESQRRAMVPVWIADLASDSTTGNATFALSRLSQIGSACADSLNEALNSTDYQQRQLAAHLLRRIAPTPSRDLLRVTVEGLGDDNLSRSDISNATNGVRYLLSHPDGIAPLLDDAMRTEDAQRRLLAAVVAGHAGLVDLLPLAAPILIDHLRDNAVPDDGVLAAPALFAFGPAVRAWLDPHHDSTDEQLRDTVRLILLELEGPAATESEHRDRRALKRITDRSIDPLRLLP